MARRFKGFNEDQMKRVAKSLGFEGPLEKFSEFLASSPGASSKFGAISEKARRIAESPPSYAEGGPVIRVDPREREFGKSDANKAKENAAGGSSAGGQNTNRNQQQVMPVAQNSRETERTAQRMADGKDIPKGALAKTATIQARPGQMISQDVGKVDTALGAGAATLPDQVTPQQAAGYTAASSTGAINDNLKNFQASQGAIRQENLVDPAQMNPEQLAQLGLQAPQAQKTQVENVPTRKVEQGEMIEGSAVDQSKVDAVTSGIEAVTGAPSTEATVQGQLTKLMSDFEGGQTPPWAAGAMRTALATLSARGLSSSSIAGQAIVQAAMESAIPIAQADAATFATFERENLSRRQQVAILAAEQRAKFLGQEFDQNFQTRVANAARISEIANKNFDTQTQVALENARLAQTVELANLDTRSAKTLADAAALTQVDLSNLDARQKARVQNAQSFLQMDLTNLDRQQQRDTIAFQELADSLLSDTAQENAARQFGAQSENQLKTFFAELASNVDIARATMMNDNAQFNATMADARTRFNATNSLAIEQSNKEWRRKITETNTAAKNLTNQLNATTIASMSKNGFDALIQLERDEVAYVNDAINRAFTGSENEKQRAADLLIEKMRMESAEDLAKLGYQYDAGKSVGGFLFKGLESVLGW